MEQNRALWMKDSLRVEENKIKMISKSNLAEIGNKKITV